MEDRYIEVYGILSDVDKLIQDDYDYLVTQYGKELVDKVIKELCDESLEYVYRLEIDNSDSKMGLSNQHLYRKQVKLFSVLDNSLNHSLLKELSIIIEEMEKIFIMYDCNNLKFDNGFKCWIEDKVFICMKKCDNSLIRNELDKLFEQYMKIRNILIEGNLKLVMSVVSKYKLENTDAFLEMIQYGNIGLMRAIENYDINKGGKFSAYACSTIYYTIKNNIRNLKYPVAVSDTCFSHYCNLVKLESELMIKLGRSVTYDEVFEYMDVSNFSLNEILVPFIPPLYLDESLEFDGEYITHGSLLVDETQDMIDIVYNKFINVISEEIIEILRNNLTDKQFLVLMHYFGFYGKCLGVTEISSIMGVSKQDIYVKKETAIKKLRKKTNIMDLVTY